MDISKIEEVVVTASFLSAADKVKLLRMLASTEGVDETSEGVDETSEGQSPAGEMRVEVPSTVEELSELTRKVIGCAMAVHRELGPGLREEKYQHAMEQRLTMANVAFEAQPAIGVYAGGDKNRLVGYYVPDLLVERRLIVELKAIKALGNDQIAQVIAYEVSSGCAVGLLFNFGERSLTWRRILPPRKTDTYRINRQWLVVPETLKPLLPPESSNDKDEDE